ncbi:Uncharacterised protein [Comamonas aquatica]|uniref:hypothetical protein n=1 Tax=Comamonas aquatica TaxID=225991 RepID=UPI001EF279C8|nr:hypothetical protein [Comamonas aquatica]CAB5646401.1 Uncharacterised protein [Comamonas aquatica]CAC9169376.1 Uncharacterised protein [Comamonas aquatica]
MSRRRQHPLVPLVLWLGVSLVASLLALVYVLCLLPSTSQLESTHTEGMKYGYELCLAWEEEKQETKTVLLKGNSL